MGAFHFHPIARLPVSLSLWVAPPPTAPPPPPSYPAAASFLPLLPIATAPGATSGLAAGERRRSAPGRPYPETAALRRTGPAASPPACLGHLTPPLLPPDALQPPAASAASASRHRRAFSSRLQVDEEYDVPTGPGRRIQSLELLPFGRLRTQHILQGGTSTTRLKIKKTRKRWQRADNGCL